MRKSELLLATVCVLAAWEASAHVTLDEPNGGEILDVGDTFAVEWNVAVEHDTIAWDLEYSTDGGATWKEIALALPPGDISTGAQHTFPWTVPDDPSDRVRVRVKQDNTDEDYYDESDEDVEILPEPASEALLTGALLVGYLGTRRRRRG